MGAAGQDLKRAFARKAAFPKELLLKGLYDKQLSFRNARASRRKINGGRRSGKTRSLAVELLYTSLPGRESAYVTLTIGIAKGILWPHMQQLNKEFSLGLRFNRTTGRITLPHEGFIELYGLNSQPDAEKLRGQGRPLGVIDEMGALNQDLVKYCLRETLGPSCLDFYGIGGAGVVIAGTPSRLTETFWHEQCKPGIRGEDPAYWHMHISENPFFAGRHEAAIQAWLEENSVTRESAAAMREIDGIFCVDSEGLVYSWSGLVLPTEAVPLVGHTLLCVDFGTTHPCAWNVLRVVNGEIFVLESLKETGCSIQRVADVCHQLRVKWNIGEMVGDSEGAQAIVSLRENHGLPMESAVKRGLKIDRIWMVDSGFKSNTLHLCPETTPLQAELRTVQWNETRDDHHPRQRDDNLDALGYGVEKCNAIKLKQQPPGPEYGSPEWLRMQEERTVREVMARAGLKPDGSRR